MVGVASQVEMRAHHIQIWPPSCRSTPLERPVGVHIVACCKRQCVSHNCPAIYQGVRLYVPYFPAFWNGFFNNEI